MEISKCLAFNVPTSVCAFRVSKSFETLVSGLSVWVLIMDQLVSGSEEYGQFSSSEKGHQEAKRIQLQSNPIQSNP